MRKKIAALLAGSLLLSGGVGGYLFPSVSFSQPTPTDTVKAMVAALNAENFGESCSYLSPSMYGTIEDCALSAASFATMFAGPFQWTVVPNSEQPVADGEAEVLVATQNGFSAPGLLTITLAKNRDGEWKVVAMERAPGQP